MRFPITKKLVRNHFQYSAWKYFLLVVIALFGWNLIYTTTRYRPPENMQVEFYADGYAYDASGNDPLQALVDQIHAEVMPEMELVSYTMLGGTDDTYGDMQLLVWASAGQGDVYLLSKDRFKSMAGNGGMLDLQPWIDSGALHVDGLELKNGYYKDEETGERVLAGIPADALTGLNDVGLQTKDMVLSVLAMGGNDEYAMKFLDYLLVHMRPEE